MRSAPRFVAPIPSALDNLLVQDSVGVVMRAESRAALTLVLLATIVLSACGRLNPGAGQASSTRSPSQTASPSESAGASSSRSPAPTFTPTPSASPTLNNCGALGTCPPANAPAQVFDPVRREIVSFGGWDYPNGQLKVFDTTWLYRGGRWTQLHPAHVPPARDNADIVFDAKSKVMVMYGGRDVPQAVAAGRGGEVGQITYSADTWTWNGNDWTELHPAHYPIFFVPDIAFDVARQVVVLLGYVGHMETWTWDGVDWTHQGKSDGLPQPVCVKPGCHTILRPRRSCASAVAMTVEKPWQARGSGMVRPGRSLQVSLRQRSSTSDLWLLRALTRLCSYSTGNPARRGAGMAPRSSSS